MSYLTLAIRHCKTCICTLYNSEFPLPVPSAVYFRQFREYKLITFLKSIARFISVRRYVLCEVGIELLYMFIDLNFKRSTVKVKQRLPRLRGRRSTCHIQLNISESAKWSCKNFRYAISEHCIAFFCIRHI
jgi:hypothetical protein